MKWLVLVIVMIGLRPFLFAALVLSVWVMADLLTQMRTRAKARKSK